MGYDIFAAFGRNMEHVASFLDHAGVAEHLYETTGMSCRARVVRILSNFAERFLQSTADEGSRGP